MAIYSLNVKSVGRTTHAPGTAAAHVRYIGRRKATEAIIGARMPLTPRSASEWLLAEEVADRRNARVITKVMIALPCELGPAERIALVHEFGEAMSMGRVPWMAAIHKPSSSGDDRNFHAHIVVRDRDPETGKTVVGLSKADSVERLRLLWEKVANNSMAAVGLAARIDRRRLVDQGLDRQPEIHVGPKVRAMEEQGIRPESRDAIDACGREIRWASEIDQNRTRSERRSEIQAENLTRANSPTKTNLSSAASVRSNDSNHIASQNLEEAGPPILAGNEKFPAQGEAKSKTFPELNDEQAKRLRILLDTSRDAEFAAHGAGEAHRCRRARIWRRIGDVGADIKNAIERNIQFKISIERISAYIIDKIGRNIANIKLHDMESWVHNLHNPNGIGE
ncbi:hypothetical protein M2323_001763 [Rhodoblastus acidophilus]|uniref:MobA/MobL family protein n=1 Tax=Rhodoblastus acidophilus TaxID=1074 RepID=UPI0022247B77|nr:MobA/MobL family protein [Rhodoblastus acidophilus]MCW2283805.1 hypothetical protein [Rhodoblastus acidophilus]MCW2332846.1 hypothetical protein [Rhodoblastus acidophilus]